MGIGKENFLVAAISVCVPVIVFLGNFALLLSGSSYLHSLAASSASLGNDLLALNQTVAGLVTADVVDYVRGRAGQLSYASLFRPEEVSHLADVRLLISRASTVLSLAAAAAVLLFVGLFFQSRSLSRFAAMAGKAVFLSGAVTVAAIAVFFILSLDFGSSFTAFHKLFFAGSQWQFPSGYLLVNLFTEDFFAAFARDIAIGALINGALLLVVGSAIRIFLRFHALNAGAK